MASTRWLLVPALCALFVPFACSDDPGNTFPKVQCADGNDNDGDGDVDFPADLGCDGDDDDSEDSLASPKCKDGRDNDGDGKTDFPNDPGCFAPQQDDEMDDCPTGPACPQCSDGMDNDMNGQTDFPNDGAGCAAASDTDEYTQNPVACGATVMIQKLPFDGKASGMLMAGAASNLMSPTCGGSGQEHVYELRVNAPKVIVATTDVGGTVADTVLSIRGSDCINPSAELVCNDDIMMTTNKKSSVTKAISTPGTYYLIVDSRDSVGGAYDVEVKFFVGEGIVCQGIDDCGPSLVCRVPFGQTQKVCAKHVCEDTIDDDQDGKNGYPMDPGCESAIDDDEADGCAAGPGPTCPECGDGIDNDSDTNIDYGMDTTCSSASSASEACVSTDGVMSLTAASTMGTTVGAVNDVKVSCATTGTHTAGDKTYRLDVPAMAELVIDNVNSFSGAAALYNSTCTGTVLQCMSFTEKLTLTNLAAGAYYYVIDGYSTGTGAFTINVSGKIQNGASCESALAQGGGISCNIGYACKGTVGSRTCQPALCSDGIDNDTDTKIDYPYDPGCTDAADDTEPDPGTAPVCSNGTDDDTDTTMDYPADFGCAAASGTTEVFCMGEMDTAAAITTKTMTGTTTGKSNDWTPTCASSTASDVAYSLQLPVAVTTLTVDTEGTVLDTIVMVRSMDCTMQLGCDDEGGISANSSKIVMNGVGAGGYAIVVDGWLSGNGVYTLNVRGTVAAQTRCDSPLFTGGAAAVLVCPTGTTCTGTPIPKCQ